MNLIEVNIKKKGGGVESLSFEIPESWNEVKDSQISSIMKLAVKPMAEIDKIREVLKAYNFKKKLMKKLFLFELREIMKLFSWLNENWSDARCLMPRLGIFKGPKDYFEGLVMNQLLMAGIHAQNADKFQEEKNPKQLKKELRKMASVLYTPFGLPYHYTLSKIYTPIFHLFPIWKLQAASISFRSQRLWLKDLFPETHKDPFDNGSRDFGPYGLIVDLAGDKFGSIKKVNYAHVIYIFTYLEKLATQQKKSDK